MTNASTSADLLVKALELEQTLDRLECECSCECQQDTSTSCLVARDLILYALQSVREATIAEVTPTQAARDVLAERERKKEGESFSESGDDAYVRGELAKAAACYADVGPSPLLPSRWPWAGHWWKPKDYRANILRACALLLAELERLDRMDKSHA